MSSESCVRRRCCGPHNRFGTNVLREVVNCRLYWTCFCYSRASTFKEQLTIGLNILQHHPTTLYFDRLFSYASTHVELDNSSKFGFTHLPDLRLALLSHRSVLRVKVFNLQQVVFREILSGPLETPGP